MSKRITVLDIAKEIKEINDALQTDYNYKDGDELSGILAFLKSQLARSNELLSQAEYLLNVAKGEASEDIPDKVPATRYKDVLSRKVASEQKVYRFVERTNASIVHIIDAVRSQLSYAKADKIESNRGVN